MSTTLPEALVDHPDYEILRELGRGGMGVVYLVHNRLMDRHEAIKVIGRHLIERPAVLERFQREIRSVAKLRHPNVVAAYSATRMGESIVYAMEYVDGIDLASLVKTKGPLPASHACYYVHQVALGLQHAHEQGIVHRDIKPGNLILSRIGDRSVVKILDFGLNKVTSDDGADYSLTHQGQMLGTPDYIAPEQTLNAQSVDIRADIYSLGCTLYYLLSGGPPFRGGSLYEVLQAHHSTEAKPLNLVRPELPAELSGIVARMMAKEPEHRFQTPADVARALTPFFKKAIVSSPPRPEVQAVATTVKAPDTSEIERGEARSGKGAVVDEPLRASRVNPTARRIAVGAGAVASLLVLTSVVVWLIPKRGANPSESAPKPGAAAVAPLTAPAPSSVPPQSESTGSPRPGPAPPSLMNPPEDAAAARPKPATPPDGVAHRLEADPTAGTGGLAAPPPPTPAPPREAPPLPKGALAAATRRDPIPAANKLATRRFDQALLNQRPRKLAYPLDRVIAKSQSYANQVVVPSGMYHLAHSRTDRSGGKRTILVTERKIQSIRDSSLGMSSSESTELEVEPNLADRLDQLDADLWRDKVAILSLWFTPDASCVLVKVEILLRYVTGFKRGTAYPQGDVDYETLRVSPQKTERVKGRDEDWEEPGRMLHFANLYKRKVMRYKKILLAQEHAQLNSVMASMWAEMMKNAASEAAQQRRLQRAISGR
jgi:serine/threonine protein kinase